MPHSPAQRKRDFGKLKFCARGAEVDERRETRVETSRHETIRQRGFANVSSSHVSARLSSHVRARTHAHLVSGEYVRGTSHIAICEKAGMRHKITVRTAYYGSTQGKSYWSNGFSRGTSIPTMSLMLRVTSVIP